MIGADVNLLLEQAFAALGAGDSARAQTLSEQIIATEPAHPHGHHLAGLALLQRGDAQAAAGHFEQAVQTDPNQPDFHLNYGVALEHLGRIDDAAEHYRSALSLASDHPPTAARAAATRGLAHRRKGG